jgi:hypothetical protein
MWLCQGILRDLQLGAFGSKHAELIPVILFSSEMQQIRETVGQEPKLRHALEGA